MRRWPRLMGAAMGLAAVAGAGTAGGLVLSGPGAQATRPPAGTDRGTPGPVPHAARLVAYDSCSQLLDQVRAQALHSLDTSGQLPEATVSSGPIGRAAVVSPGVMEPAAAAPAAMNGTSSAASSGAGTAAGSGDAAPGSSPSFSTTNDQEAGVDEPDLAKTDGTVLVALRQTTDTLEVTSVSGAPGLLGSLALTNDVNATGLFLVGKDVVVLGSAVSSSTSPPVPQSPPTGVTGASGGASAGVVPVMSTPPDTEVAVVDISNPAQPTLTRSFAIQGDEVDARLIGGVVEVVVSSGPTVPMVVPASGGAADSAAALAANRLAVEQSTPSQWLPSVTSEPSGTTTTAPCSSAMHTTDASGLDTIGVVPIDPSSDQPGPEATVVGDAGAVYASTSKLYVAFPTASGSAPSGDTVPVSPSEESTTVDAFDLSNPEAPSYLGSGVVPGTLLGQYAMSEYQGDLRVASTVGTPTPAPQDGSAPSTPSDNRVTVLAPRSGALATVGTITGLGTGEQIYAVRFEGPLGFVVTFHQTDPLFVLDLSDPAHPALAGQLPLTGYSSFLQPLGNGMLLGVGQGVDSNLRTDGLQVSLFDVSNPAAPALLDKDVVAGATSSAEQDPHALLYWAAAGLVVMPVDESGACTTCAQPLGSGALVAPATSSGPAAAPAPFVGALAWKVSGNSLGTATQISQPQSSTTPGGPVPDMVMPAANAGIERALVVGDKLYTVSDGGILASDLGSLAAVSWIPWS